MMMMTLLLMMKTSTIWTASFVVLSYLDLECWHIILTDILVSRYISMHVKELGITYI